MRSLWETTSTDAYQLEDPDYLTSQLITYIGNKRTLISAIGKAVSGVSTRLSKEKLVLCDAFAGSGVVSRSFKQYASKLISNDLEQYAETIARCYLSNREELCFDELSEQQAWLDTEVQKLPVQDGVIRRLYSPNDDDNVQLGERVFYTSTNAAKIDSYRALIAELPEPKQHLFLGPLLASASVHTNTSGVFKGFYKNRQGIGQFGGEHRNALSRITGTIWVDLPIMSKFSCDVDVCRCDANELVRSLDERLDVLYLDPPYNQHPYGSNYFMLNLIVNQKEPTEISRISGIPVDWNRSPYNKPYSALTSLIDLIEHANASHILLSYNSEGFISRKELETELRRRGRLSVIDIPYNTFRGSRNLRSRSIHVMEHLFLLEKY